MVKKFYILYQSLLSLYNYRLKKTIVSNYPTYFYVEPTNHCNLRCIMCPNGRGMTKIQKGYMDFELYMRIIDQIKPFTSTVLLAVGGEPLLHPKFSQMVRYASKAGIKTMINTNATLLTKELSHQLLDANLDMISFAFDGHTKENYESARRGANFEETLGNILYFLKLKNKAKSKIPHCTLSMLMLDGKTEIDEEKKKFFGQFKGLINNIRLREVNSWGANLKEDTNFICRESKNVFNPCGRLWSMLCVKWDGVVVPCICNFNNEYQLGNLQTDNILDIWNGEHLVGLRQAMLKNSHQEISPICENCAITDSKTILGIPAGIRAILSDAVVNFSDNRLEEYLLRIMDSKK
ncbi:radical SAM/SPASM domain-containing protein [Desulfobacula phenolica]|uniref:Radical SAM additional 4Fe4S-binding SPASM domain-containing protein n=1 Tax=Desulfobacula phenolica TaxID=90732 RepID=A0A1H2DRN9_9BACT|nr:radical SAM/SPASM domain-containing protein [Desulfobacula phenolica]SDT85563.1 radical SAM additional 4Fe4S-binding SPASM domain-containing protein [Desulfobacula phenolica]